VAQIPIIPGKAEAILTARGRAVRIPPQLLDAPGGLYPLMSAAFEVDEYRIKSGWPVPVPDIDIRIDCLVSAEGDKITNRPEPTALVTNADMRWVADANYYDEVACRWTPIQSNVSPWTCAPESTPTLITDYEYRFGDERFVNMTALNFDSNTADSMTNDLGLSIGGVQGYTLIMVMSPNSIYGNDPSVLENVLWGPQETDGNWVMLTITDQAVWMRTESKPAQKGVAIGNALQSTAPSYLAVVVGRPTTTLYAASGPTRVLVKSLPAGPVAESLSTRFWLGNGPLPGTGSVDMALLDLGIYGNPLTKDQVVAEFAELCKVYGGET